MNGKKIIALLLCFGLAFQSTVVGDTIVRESTALKASAAESENAKSDTAKTAAEESGEKASHQVAESTGEEHAYDPIGDMEAQQEYRDSTEIVEGRVLFSMLGYHSGRARAFWQTGHRKATLQAMNFSMP